MAVKLFKFPNTDVSYAVSENSTYLGDVRKAYLTRTTTAWTIDPANFVVDGLPTTRLCYTTRKQAVAALQECVTHPHRMRHLTVG